MSLLYLKKFRMTIKLDTRQIKAKLFLRFLRFNFNIGCFKQFHARSVSNHNHFYHANRTRDAIRKNKVNKDLLSDCQVVSK